MTTAKMILSGPVAHDVHNIIQYITIRFSDRFGFIRIVLLGATDTPGLYNSLDLIFLILTIFWRSFRSDRAKIS